MSSLIESITKDYFSKSYEPRTDLAEGEVDISAIKTLNQGYVDYAEELISNRALPKYTDGLKPVHRKIAYSLFDLSKSPRTKGFIKSSKADSDVINGYHPHGSVYQSLALMTDSNGSLQFPLVSGKGAFGNYYGGQPAAPRYTECKIHDAVFEQMEYLDGVPMVDNYDGTKKEPTDLPVTFPMLLVNGSEGIAVGFSTYIPSFNFNDVIDLTLEYLETGDCKTVIAPDFVSSGYLVNNEKEFLKLMTTGNAKLKNRAKIIVDEKKITVVEVPYQTTTESLGREITKAVKAGKISGIERVSHYNDSDGIDLSIRCTSKRVTESVLFGLLRHTSLQQSVSCRLLVLDDNYSPLEIGVWDYIKKWTNWRRGVVQTCFNKQIASLKADIHAYGYLIRLIEQPEMRDVFVDKCLHIGDASAHSYLLENLEVDGVFVDVETAKWIRSRSLPTLRDGGRYRNTYADLMTKLRYFETTPVDKVVGDDLRHMKSKYGKDYPRKTEITNQDYDFSSLEENEKVAVKDTTNCTFILKNNFLQKRAISGGAVEENADMVLQGVASDTLVMIDNRGRVLRAYCENIGYASGITDTGEYLPKYFDLNEDDDYKILWMGLLDGSRKLLIYNDGNLGYLDTSEWVVCNRQVKVIENGIAVSIADKLRAVVDLDTVENKWLVVTDNLGNISCESLENVKFKGRTARTRVFNTKRDAYIDSYYLTDYTDILPYCNNIPQYLAPSFRKQINVNDFSGCAESFVLI